MVRQRKAFTVFAGALVAMFAVACGSSQPSASNSPAAVTVGMALAAPINDQGFAQAHYQGLMSAKQQFGISTSVVPNALSEDQRVNALTALAQKNQLVIAVGGEFAAAAPQVAPQFPNVTFIVINGPSEPAIKNYHTYVYREGVPAYIAGVVLAKLSKNHHAGFVGGELIPTAAQARDAFTAGVRSVDPSAKVDVTIVGTFQDPQKTQAATAADISGGADVLYGYEAGTGWPGIPQAVQASGKQVYVASNIVDKCSAGSFMVGNSLLNGGETIIAIVDGFVHHNLPAGDVPVGVQNAKIQSFTLCAPFQSQFGDLVKTTTDGINNNSITLPSGV